METLQKLTLVDGMEQWTLFPEGSPASPTQPQENDSAKKMNATCGPKCLEQFARFPRVGLWAKTFAGLLIGTTAWYSTKCRLTWKLKGTKSNRFYFQLAPSTLPTEEIEFGLLPTPTAQDGKNSSLPPSQANRDSLVGIILPTPVASDYHNRWPTENWKGLDLASVVNGKLGTRSHLNPRFVGEMMGFPVDWTELPFQSGETKV
jgi:hypothetical protein